MLSWIFEMNETVASIDSCINILAEENATKRL